MTTRLLKKSIVIVAMAMVGSCGTPPAATPSPATLRTPPYYPQPSQRLKDLISASFPSVQSVAEIGGYNDVQALQRNGNSTEYGPEAGLYVAPKTYVETDYQDPLAPLVAFIEVAGATDNSSNSAYNSLKLDHADTTAIYCVYLTYKLDGSGKKHWDGYVVPINTNTSCAGLQANKKLNADELSDSRYPQQADYPFTARWVDTEDDMPTIGVTCAVAFCRIGRGNGDVNTGNGTSNDKQRDLKPWHDNQKLAVPGAKLTRDVRAMVVPVSRLDTIKKNDFKNGAKSALVTMRAGANAKYTNWGLQDGDNDVYVKMIVTGTDTSWAASFVKAGDAAPTTWSWKVYRTPHDNMTVPGTARWIWHPQDEEIWLACDQGCCIVSNDAFSSPSSLPLEVRGKGPGKKR